MIQLGALQFVWTLIKKTRRVPFVQRVVLVAAGTIIYGSFYVSSNTANRSRAKKASVNDKIYDGNDTDGSPRE